MADPVDWHPDSHAHRLECLRHQHGTREVEVWPLLALGDALRLNFGFRCDLCPQVYTLTVASHDPNGVWHDWLEDAVSFSVTDPRPTAGVANLRAQVSIERLPQA